MNLSRFFTLAELTHSNTAQAEGIDNQPTATEIESLRALCTAVLDPLREALGKPIKVTSGYRGPALNRRVKGAAKSQHLSGEAADLQSPGTAVLELFKLVIRLGLPFDQVIYEVNGAAKWVHVSHSRGGNAGEILLGKFDAAGKVTYPRLSAQEALALNEPAARARGRAVEPGYLEMGDEPPRAARKAPKPAPTAKKVAAKKAVVEQAVAPKKVAPRKPAARTVAEKPVAKKIAVKKVAAKKTPLKKAAAKKTS